MIVWIGKTLALAIHDRQLAQHGGATGLRDEALLDSALARPQPLYAYGEPPPDLADLTASLAYGLACNHAFVDGNKRTAHVCYRVFLRLNGADLQAKDEEKYAAMMGLAGGDLSEAAFAAWLRPRIVTNPVGQIQEPAVVYCQQGQECSDQM
ncbi:type II toxin-antitoxin system death-on-curing family toxin [Alcaligenaceae bacterium SJ-26]|nr:type II toxin-antitoxin system death-on-curing family toxin [Alcaligenaceae bacterium SJ-26]